MSETQTLSAVETEVALTHEEEVQNLFLEISVAIPGLSPNIRALSYETFKMGIDQMMNKAHYYTAQATMKSVNEIMDNVFNKNR